MSESTEPFADARSASDTVAARSESLSVASATTRDEKPKTLGISATLLILATAAISIFFLLGYGTTLNEHEVFAAQPAREMLDGGSMVLQPFGGTFRVKKPPGQSWLIASSIALTGMRNELAARIPSAAAGFGVALLTAMIGARLAGRRIGLIAGLMTLTCYAVQVRAQLAEADMCLSFSVMIAFVAMLWPLLSPTGYRRLLPFVFWLALAAGVFIKGPIALCFVLIPASLFLCITKFVLRNENAFAAVRRVVLNPWAASVWILLVFGWFIAAIVTHPDVVVAWRHELFGRVRAKGPDSFWSYAAYIPLALLPWTVFCFAGFARSRAALKHPAGLLLALWSVAGTVFISFIAFKRMHYALPLLPPLTLIAARGFDVVLSHFLSRRDPQLHRKLTMIVFAGWFGTATVAWVVNQVVLEPRAREHEIVMTFVNEVNASVPSDQSVYLAGDAGEERTSWYIERPIIQTRHTVADPLETQLARLPADRDAYVLCRGSNVEAIQALRLAIVVARSADVRGRGSALEERALLRVSPRTVQSATLPSAQP